MSDNNNPLDQLAAMMPSRQQKLKIWAIRSVIVLVLAGALTYFGGPMWVLWLALAYVVLTLVLAFVLTKPVDGG